MSEPTNGGTQRPDPDPDKSPGQDENDVQDAPPDTVFNDPTAPVWADPTAPIPTPPTPPVAPPPVTPPPVTPPLSNPYAQQPPGNPYAQPSQPYAQQPPSQPYAQQGGTQYPAYGQQTYATGPHAETNGSAIVLTILSGIFMLSTCFIVGIPSLIFGIMALTSNSTDPTGSRKKAKTGWIVFAVNFGVVVLLAIVAFGLLIATGNNLDSNDFNY